MLPTQFAVIHNFDQHIVTAGLHLQQQKHHIHL